jgi:hypothetical protein
MGRPESVYDLHNTRQAQPYVIRNGGEIRNGGRHILAYKDGRGPAVMPGHAEDWPTGTRHSIIRMLLALGFTIFLICFVVHYFPLGGL